jgi:hypothetical protein
MIRYSELGPMLATTYDRGVRGGGGLTGPIRKERSEHSLHVTNTRSNNRNLTAVNTPGLMLRTDIFRLDNMS